MAYNPTMDKFWAIAAVVFIAELPCLLRTFALQTQSESTWKVIGATVLGNVLALAAGLLLAKVVSSALTESLHDHLKVISGILFIFLGAYLLLEHHH